MKRQWIYALCCLVVAAGTAFVACDDSDHTSNHTTTFDRLEMIFTYDVSEDLLTVADVLISYTAPDGQTTTASAPLTTTEWIQIFSVKEFPATAVIDIQVTMKEGITLDKDSYTLIHRWTDEFKEFRSDGKVHWFEAPDQDEHTQTFTRNPGDPDALLQQITTAVNLMSRTYRYTVTPDPDGSGYEVIDND